MIILTGLSLKYDEDQSSWMHRKVIPQVGLRVGVLVGVGVFFKFKDWFQSINIF